MAKYTETERILEAIRGFYKENDGDDATTSILIALGAEILDCSEDRFLELMGFDV